MLILLVVCFFLCIAEHQGCYLHVFVHYGGTGEVLHFVGLGCIGFGVILCRAVVIVGFEFGRQFRFRAFRGERDVLFAVFGRGIGLARHVRRAVPLRDVRQAPQPRSGRAASGIIYRVHRLPGDAPRLTAGCLLIPAGESPSASAFPKSQAARPGAAAAILRSSPAPPEINPPGEVFLSRSRSLRRFHRKSHG